MTTKPKKRAKAPAKKPVPAPKLEVMIADDHKDEIVTLGFDMEWLEKIAKKHKITKFEYVNKLKAFRCYQKERHADWLSVNDIAHINGQKDIVDINLHYQVPAKDNQVFDLRWR